MLHIKILRLKKVLVLATANAIGEPSPPTLCSNLSHSSSNSMRIGLLASPALELDPTIEIWPPANFLCIVVFDESFLLASATQSFSFSLSLIIAASLSLLKACPIERLGCTTKIGEAS